MTTTIKSVDYHDPQQADELRVLLNAYASDPMGGGASIDPTILEKLPSELAKQATAFSLIAYVNDQPAALVNCFYGFSTFAARRLINIHDVVVLKEYRGRGLSGLLMQEIERIGRENDCCKLTLEVLDKNAPAMNAYRKWGFDSYELDLSKGKAVFWQKKL